MDKLNKITSADTQLHYEYKGKSDIPIGVLGFVDDTLGVSECGNESIKTRRVTHDTRHMTRDT